MSVEEEEIGEVRVSELGKELGVAEEIPELLAAVVAV